MRWVLLILVWRLHAQELGAFAFADAAGVRLISTANPVNPGSLHTAICGGARVPVTFERRQEGQESRQTAKNFDRLAGHVYRVQGKVAGGSTCFLAADGLAPVTAEGADCKQVGGVRPRAVTNCWTLASSPALLVQFAHQGTDALASVVVRDGARLLFADFPAKFRGEGEDIWRVDDGGELDPQYIRVVFLLRRGASIVLGIDWAGTEGNDLSVFVSDVDRFTKAIDDYWYRAPE